MSNTFGVTPLILGLVNKVALEIFHHFVAIDWDGPFTPVLVCTACLMGGVGFGGLVTLLIGRLRMTTNQAMKELASIGAETLPKDDDLVTTEVAMTRLCKSIKSLRRDRRRPNPALTENRENTGKGICIVSFDGGGPGSMSQLRMLDEIMTRIAFQSNVGVDEVLPADYFDLMGGVGFGGLVALLLGRLRMTTTEAMEELALIGAVTFPKGGDLVTTEVTMARLRKAIESMLEHYGHSVDVKLRDSSINPCKAVLFAATTDVMHHCHPFRTYRSPRKCLDCTLIDAACATMATSEHFSPVVIGPRLRRQTFAGIPHGFDNPMREVIKEAQLIFGEKNPVSLVLSLGSGQRAPFSDPARHVTRQSRIHCDAVERDLQYQLRGFGEYLRLNVDKGMETIKLDDWHKLGSIESYTDVYLEMNQITRYIDRVVPWLLKRNGSVTLGQISGTNTDCLVTFHSESPEKYLAMEFKEMRNVVQQSGIEKITLVDAIGNNIPIPLEFCVTYTMLLDVISLYFKHRKAPGNDFVERGDYRLVHGNRRNLVGRMEWSSMEKVGLKVEMSMIIHTHNGDEERCPRCRAMFEGRSIDGWAQCLSCTGHFQVETQVQPDTEDQSSDDTAQSDDNPLVEPGEVVPTAKESQSGEHLTGKRTGSAEAVELEFRLISVINLLEINVHQDRELADNASAKVQRASLDNFQPMLEDRLFTVNDANGGTREYKPWEQPSGLYDPEARSSPNSDFEDHGLLAGKVAASSDDPPDFRPTMEGRLFTAHDSIISADSEVHPTARLLYDSLPQLYRDVFKNCPMYLEKHLEFVKYLRHLSLDDLDKRNEPRSERNLIKTLGIPVLTEEGDKKKWQCGAVGCEYRGTLQHLVSHLRTKSHLGIPTFACTLGCKILFHHSQDRDRHVKEKTCLKSHLVEDAAERRGWTRSLKGVQDTFVAVPKPKVKSRLNQHLEKGRESDYFAPPQPSNVSTARDGRVGMYPASHASLTPDFFRPNSILPPDNGAMHATVITNNAMHNFLPISNSQFTLGSQPVNPGFNPPTDLTYAYPGFDPGVTTGSQDLGQSSTKFYGDDAPQVSHRVPQHSRQAPPYGGASNRPEAWGLTGIKKEIKEEEQEMRVDLESGVAAMDVTP